MGRTSDSTGPWLEPFQQVRWRATPLGPAYSSQAPGWHAKAESTRTWSPSLERVLASANETMPRRQRLHVHNASQKRTTCGPLKRSSTGEPNDRPAKRNAPPRAPPTASACAAASGIDLMPYHVAMYTAQLCVQAEQQARAQHAGDAYTDVLHGWHPYLATAATATPAQLHSPDQMPLEAGPSQPAGPHEDPEPAQLAEATEPGSGARVSALSSFLTSSPAARSAGSDLPPRLPSAAAQSPCATSPGWRTDRMRLRAQHSGTARVDAHCGPHQLQPRTPLLEEVFMSAAAGPRQPLDALPPPGHGPASEGRAGAGLHALSHSASALTLGGAGKGPASPPPAMRASRSERAPVTTTCTELAPLLLSASGIDSSTGLPPPEPRLSALSPITPGQKLSGTQRRRYALGKPIGSAQPGLTRIRPHASTDSALRTSSPAHASPARPAPTKPAARASAAASAVHAFMQRAPPREAAPLLAPAPPAPLATPAAPALAGAVAATLAAQERTRRCSMCFQYRDMGPTCSYCRVCEGLRWDGRKLGINVPALRQAVAEGAPDPLVRAAYYQAAHNAMARSESPKGLVPRVPPATSPDAAVGHAHMQLLDATHRSDSQQQGWPPQQQQSMPQQLHDGVAGQLGTAQDRCITCYGKCGQPTVTGQAHCKVCSMLRQRVREMGYRVSDLKRAIKAGLVPGLLDADDLAAIMQRMDHPERDTAAAPRSLGAPTLAAAQAGDAHLAAPTGQPPVVCAPAAGAPQAGGAAGADGRLRRCSMCLQHREMGAESCSYCRVCEVLRWRGRKQGIKVPSLRQAVLEGAEDVLSRARYYQSVHDATLGRGVPTGPEDAASLTVTMPQSTVPGAESSDAGATWQLEAGQQNPSMPPLGCPPYEVAVQQQQQLLQQRQQDQQQRQHEVHKQAARAAHLQGASSGRCVTCFGKCGQLLPECSHCEVCTELRLRVKAVGFGLSDLKRAIKSGYITGLVEPDTLQLILTSMQIELGGLQIRVQPASIARAAKRREARLAKEQARQAQSAGASAEAQELLRDVQASLDAKGAPRQQGSIPADALSVRPVELVRPDDPEAQLAAVLATLPASAASGPAAEAIAALLCAL